MTNISASSRGDSKYSKSNKFKLGLKGQKMKRLIKKI